MVGESNQNFSLIKIDASNFAKFDISEFEIARVDYSAFVLRNTFTWYLIISPRNLFLIDGDRRQIKSIFDGKKSYKYLKMQQYHRSALSNLLSKHTRYLFFIVRLSVRLQLRNSEQNSFHDNFLICQPNPMMWPSLKSSLRDDSNEY